MLFQPMHRGCRGQIGIPGFHKLQLCMIYEFMEGKWASSSASNSPGQAQELLLWDLHEGDRVALKYKCYNLAIGHRAGVIHKACDALFINFLKGISQPSSIGQHQE